MIHFHFVWIVFLRCSGDRANDRQIENVARTRACHRIVEIRLAPHPLIINRDDQIAMFLHRGLFQQRIRQQLEREENRAGCLGSRYHSASLSGCLKACSVSRTILVDAGDFETMLFGTFETDRGVLHPDAEAAGTVTRMPAMTGILVALTRSEFAIDRCVILARAELAVARNLIAAGGRRPNSSLRRNLEGRVVATLRRERRARGRFARLGSAGAALGSQIGIILRRCAKGRGKQECRANSCDSSQCDSRKHPYACERS